jgi:hypothetical protein
MEFQRRSWLIQRCCWIVMAGVVVAALAGLFGAGKLSQAISASKTFSVGYEPFAQYTAPTKLVLRIEELSSKNPIRIHIDQAYAKNLKFEHILPWPENIKAGDHSVVFSFSTEGSGPMYVTFHVAPEKIGHLRASVGLEGSEAVTFSQFIYP